jgi:hypothetical protein
VEPSNEPEHQFALTPWGAVGGCGAGGSGGGGGDGIKWIGQGISGGLVDLEVLPKFSAGQNFQTFTVAPRFSYKLFGSTAMGLTVPFSSKTAEVQHRSNLPAQNRTTGGLGDLSFDVSSSFGPSGELSLSLGLTIPNAQYDIKRGSDRDASFLPSSLQKGSGLYNSSIGIGFSKDVEEGLWIFDLSYSHPWIMRPFSGQNEMLDSYFTNYKNNNDERFAYKWKFYGENDFGDFTPSSLSTALYYGYRGTPGMVHSFGFTFSAPLGVAWIRDPTPGIYNPKPDPDHKAWSASLVYGAEFIRDTYPIFIAFALPIQDQSASSPSNEWDEQPMSEWNAPDWSEFLEQWTIAVGFKTTMF